MVEYKVGGAHPPVLAPTDRQTDGHRALDWQRGRPHSLRYVVVCDTIIQINTLPFIYDKCYFRMHKITYNIK